MALNGIGDFHPRNRRLPFISQWWRQPVAVGWKVRMPAMRKSFVLIGTSVAAALMTASVCGVTVPPGFSIQQFAGGLSNPTAIAFAPDGRVFIAEQRGTVRVIINGVVQPNF